MDFALFILILTLMAAVCILTKIISTQDATIRILKHDLLKIGKDLAQRTDRTAERLDELARCRQENIEFTNLISQLNKEIRRLNEEIRRHERDRYNR